MRRNAGFTLVEMMISTALFLAGAIYIYATFSGVTKSSRSATLEIDLGSQNKKALTRMFAELQATSLTPQDTDGLQSTEPEPVLIIEDDPNAPLPMTTARIVDRPALGTGDLLEGETYTLGESKTQARERVITVSKRIQFRKVIGYQFNATAGTIIPEWSPWITFRVNRHHQLERIVEGRSPRVIANRVDAFDAQVRPDGTILVTTITARRHPTEAGWRRYANVVTIHPKN